MARVKRNARKRAPSLPNQLSLARDEDKRRFSASPVDGVNLLYPADDPSKVIGYCIGPESSLYHSTLILFHYLYTPTYPFRLPEFRVLTPLFHPSVYQGKCYLPCLSLQYSRVCIVDVLEEFRHALKYPNFENCVNKKVGQWYREGKFEEKVRKSLKLGV